MSISKDQILYLAITKEAENIDCLKHFKIYWALYTVKLRTLNFWEKAYYYFCWENAKIFFSLIMGIILFSCVH